MATIFDEIFGQKPDVAKYRKQNLGAAQTESLLGNISSFGDIAKLGDLYTQYMTDSQNKQLPGYSDTLALGEKGAQDILKQGESFLHGELPQDLIDKSLRDSAFGALSGGFAGSGMSRGLTARDLGLTSLDLMGRGANMIGQGGNEAQKWASMAKGNIYDPDNALTNPWQQEQANMQNEVYRQQSQQMVNNVSAAPNPTAQGIYNATMGALGSAAGAWNFGNLGQASTGGAFAGSQAGGSTGGSGGGRL